MDERQMKDISKDGNGAAGDKRRLDQMLAQSIQHQDTTCGKEYGNQRHSLGGRLA